MMPPSPAKQAQVDRKQARGFKKDDRMHVEAEAQAKIDSGAQENTRYDQ
jgi:hypothetical protein